MCRQGLEAIQLTYELDVLINEYSQDESVLPSGGISRDGTFCPPEAKPLLKGRLHLRMANIGYPSEGKHIKTGNSNVFLQTLFKAASTLFLSCANNQTCLVSIMTC